MTIYLDVVMIENLIMNSIIIYATAIITKVEIKHIRIILSSFIGASYSILSYISGLKIYSELWLKIMLSVIMVYIAFNPKDLKKLGKEMKNLPHEFGAAIGYSMIMDEIKTLDDAINEATLEMITAKEEMK